MQNDPIKNNLTETYNRYASERETHQIDDWKIKRRASFLSLLQQENKRTFLEIGAGTGRDSKFFKDNGMDVTCIDMSPEMVKLCKQKGLTAHIMDMTNLEFSPNSFDSVYSFNSLLHISNDEFRHVLENIRQVLAPNGLFYLGTYGGNEEFEGIWEKDSYIPKRFFSLRTDEQIQQITTQIFELLSFEHVTIEGNDSHFQSLILRKSI